MTEAIRTTGLPLYSFLSFAPHEQDKPLPPLPPPPRPHKLTHRHGRPLTADQSSNQWLTKFAPNTKPSSQRPSTADSANRKRSATGFGTVVALPHHHSRSGDDPNTSASSEDDDIVDFFGAIGIEPPRSSSWASKAPVDIWEFDVLGFQQKQKRDSMASVSVKNVSCPLPAPPPAAFLSPQPTATTTTSSPTLSPTLPPASTFTSPVIGVTSLSPVLSSPPWATTSFPAAKRLSYPSAGTNGNAVPKHDLPLQPSIQDLRSASTATPPPVPPPSSFKSPNGAQIPPQKPAPTSRLPRVPPSPLLPTAAFHSTIEAASGPPTPKTINSAIEHLDASIVRAALHPSVINVPSATASSTILAVPDSPLPRPSSEDPPHVPQETILRPRLRMGSCDSLREMFEKEKRLAELREKQAAVLSGRLGVRPGTAGGRPRARSIGPKNKRPSTAPEGGGIGPGMIGGGMGISSKDIFLPTPRSRRPSTARSVDTESISSARQRMVLKKKPSAASIPAIPPPPPVVEPTPPAPAHTSPAPPPSTFKLPKRSSKRPSTAPTAGAGTIRRKQSTVVEEPEPEEAPCPVGVPVTPKLPALNMERVKATSVVARRHTWEEFDPDALLSFHDLFNASSIPVYDANGKKVWFGHLFKDQVTVVVFIRHFWCPMCQDYMKSLVSEVDPAHLEASGVRMVIIGCGDPAMIRPYNERMFHSPYELYTDPTLELHAALGMTLKTFDAGPENEKGAYVKHGTLVGTLNVVGRALMCMPPHVLVKPGGDTKQLGGEFVLGPGFRCRYAHRMKYTRDHAPIKEVVQQAGVDFNPIPHSLRPFHLSAAEEDRWMVRRDLALQGLRAKKLERRHSMTSSVHGAITVSRRMGPGFGGVVELNEPEEDRTFSMKEMLEGPM